MKENKINKKGKEKPYTIKINHEIEQGAYANAASVHYTGNECTIDFIYTLPGTSPKEMKVISRINMTHKVAKSFLSALSNATLDFENKKK